MLSNKENLDVVQYNMDGVKHPSKSILKDNTMPILHDKRRVSFAPEVTLHKIDFLPSSNKRRKTIGFSPAQENESFHDNGALSLEQMTDSSDDDDYEDFDKLQENADQIISGMNSLSKNDINHGISYEQEETEEEMTMELTGQINMSNDGQIYSSISNVYVSTDVKEGEFNEKIKANNETFENSNGYISADIQPSPRVVEDYSSSDEVNEDDEVNMEITEGPKLNINGITQQEAISGNNKNFVEKSRSADDGDGDGDGDDMEVTMNISTVFNKRIENEGIEEEQTMDLTNMSKFNIHKTIETNKNFENNVYLQNTYSKPNDTKLKLVDTKTEPNDRQSNQDINDDDEELSDKDMELTAIPLKQIRDNIVLDRARKSIEENVKYANVDVNDHNDEKNKQEALGKEHSNSHKAKSNINSIEEFIENSTYKNNTYIQHEGKIPIGVESQYSEPLIMKLGQNSEPGINTQETGPQEIGLLENNKFVAIEKVKPQPEELQVHQEEKPKERIFSIANKSDQQEQKFWETKIIQNQQTEQESQEMELTQNNHPPIIENNQSQEMELTQNNHPPIIENNQSQEMELTQNNHHPIIENNQSQEMELTQNNHPLIIGNNRPQEMELAQNIVESKKRDIGNIHSKSLVSNREMVTTTTIPLADITSDSSRNLYDDDDDNDNDNYIPVTLNDFLNDIGIKFYDDLDIDIDSINRLSISLTKQSFEFNLVDYIRSISKLQLLALYEFSCEELNKNIQEGKNVFSEFNKTIENNNPQIFKDYYLSDESEKFNMNMKLQLIKDYTRHQSKKTWYDWRTQLTNNLIIELEGKYTELTNDKEILISNIRVLDDHILTLKGIHEKLSQKVKNIIDIDKYISFISPEELRILRDKLIDSKTKLKATKSEIDLKQGELDRINSEIMKMTQTKALLVETLTTKEQKLSNTKKYELNDIKVLNFKFNLLQNILHLQYIKSEGRVFYFKFDKLINIQIDFSNINDINNIHYSIDNDSIQKSTILHKQLVSSFLENQSLFINEQNIIDHYKNFKFHWDILKKIDIDLFRISLKFPIVKLEFEKNGNILFDIKYFNAENNLKVLISCTISFRSFSKYPENSHISATVRSSNVSSDIIRQLLVSDIVPNSLLTSVTIEKLQFNRHILSN